ncbi:MAG: hypothetical protein ACR2PG_22610 [Hyphomicrobiaceae bacterium]
MPKTVAKLEKDWLEAEARADELKALVKRNGGLSVPDAPAERGAQCTVA